MCVLYHLKFEDRASIQSTTTTSSTRRGLHSLPSMVSWLIRCEFGSVYLTEIDGNAEVVIAGHYFTEPTDQW